MITINGLTVKFGGVTALDDLTVALEDRIVGVIGPNGAGKTTLTNALSGFVQPAAGKAHIDGVDMLGLPPHQRSRRGLARSFQKVQIVPDLTVRDHLMTVLEANGTERSERRQAIDQALEYVGMQDKVSRLGASLNLYEQRLTEIAKCLVGNPRVILLDEPGGGLSESETQHLRKLITGIRDAYNAQILLIDHDVELIRDVCSALVVLDFGRLISSGPTEDVLADEAVKTAYLGL